MPRANDPESPTEITMTRNDKTYSAFYRVEGGVVTVTTISGRKSTQVGGSTAEFVARMLLRELIDEGKG